MALDVRETGEPAARPPIVSPILRQTRTGASWPIFDSSVTETPRSVRRWPQRAWGRARLRARRPDELGRRAIEEARRCQDGWLTRVFGLPKNPSPQELGRRVRRFWPRPAKGAVRRARVRPCGAPASGPTRRRRRRRRPWRCRSRTSVSGRDRARGRPGDGSRRRRRDPAGAAAGAVLHAGGHDHPDGGGPAHERVSEAWDHASSCCCWSYTRS